MSVDRSLRSVEARSKARLPRSHSRLRQDRNHPERPRKIVARAGRKEELVHGSILAGPVPETDSPQLVDRDRSAVCFSQLADKLSVGGIEAIDGPMVGVV